MYGGDLKNLHFGTDSNLRENIGSDNFIETVSLLVVDKFNVAFNSLSTLQCDVILSYPGSRVTQSGSRSKGGNNRSLKNI